VKKSILFGGFMKKQMLIIAGIITAGFSLYAIDDSEHEYYEYTDWSREQANFERFARTGECRGCDFKPGTDFRAVVASLNKLASDRYVKGNKDKFTIDLTDAILPEANFAGSDLYGAKLDGAFCGEANFEGAQLNWTSCVKTNFGGANLENSTLSSGNFYEANFNGANLKCATITPGGVWNYDTMTNLRKITARKADFRGAEFALVHLNGADFRDADFRGAKKSFSADFSKANLQGARISD
jgi:uncharacterized protein YjbI with pentapeptide repeats